MRTSYLRDPSAGNRCCIESVYLTRHRFSTDANHDINAAIDCDNILGTQVRKGVEGIRV